ncbi:Crp/Fnr family transcriptional regulator [Mucilaginibacter rubeus]|uniref:Crp/Fnr family transcriptional regulator n=1 Tax=Mucilaginibacter rubeus TaxID=2027860 RepID=A0AAE6JGK2_9SPHI|nr:MULTISPECIES: Crp/Fnr family transcriptional regulator [Mucilaginibacter]QEM05033.1 Crp/Fnr family transcriptional regulator [Mucilaginibacter rubeus]QEM17628.1 Crp/Fnr family transcriptional regulator [Mucilaginibacter gossypii]QTE45852.1 Crp/Fnr family transcriptional regulator [Mucilaginibacter rubeus]QTE52449.1 Crp/Fnr family transcriptional regulator [Mucilaginibacter rubeus]QTE57537.1 Crp/Fnr family transcriptional regulator [Mucilaginibacter rubeus]
MDIENLSVAALLKFFEQYFPLNLAERKEVAVRFTERSVKRRGYILQQGDVAKYFTFVVSGCFRQYVVDETGKEYNLQFAVENEWITDLCSFYSETASNTYIEALEPSVILQIKHDDLLFLYTHYHKFDRNFRIIVEKKYIDLQNRVMQNISITAENRYTNFMARYPNLANRLPNVHIATYLGITPEFLSKVRKKMVRPA